MSQGFGIEGKRKYTGEFKFEVIQDISDNEISFKEAGRKYELSDTLSQMGTNLFRRR